MDSNAEAENRFAHLSEHLSLNMASRELATCSSSKQLFDRPAF
jgi:hypothetical protein